LLEKTPAKSSPPKKLSKAARFAQKYQNKSAKSVEKTPAKSSPPKKLSKTPNKNETILQANVTFMDRSADISSIPVLSPPKSRKARKPVNEASFQ
jgi:hypothetical protein